MLAERQALIGRTRDLLAQRRVHDAEQLLLEALAKDRTNADLLELLADFYEQLRRPDEVARALTRCIEVEPERSRVYFALAAVLEQLGRENEIVDLYARLCVVRPELATAHFNRAVYLRRFGRLDEAAAAYRTAIDLGIDGPADAWSNLGVVLGELERHDESRDAFVQALAVDASWIPARYNLGLLHEEFGERAAALEQFERVLAIDPDHHDAFARVVHASARRDEAIAERVRLRLLRTDLSPAARETLSFALGDTLDACGRYDEAFAAFAAGNLIARGRAQPYDRVAEEHDLAMLAGRFGPSWLGAAQSVSVAPLVFVCGMWRSGTTLLERMLGGHPALTPGGEIAYFTPSAVSESIRLAGPHDAAAALQALGQGYDAMLERRFSGGRVINKRPDTWRHMGLLRGLFPEAKFIVMQRDPSDTCLSIFFQQLDAAQLPFTTDLADIAHHLRGCRELVRYWRTLFPAQILEVQYEELVNRPERTLEAVCRFLGLAWDGQMLDFPEQRTRVRTASVWQVREPVHLRSVGRWRHYRTHLRAIVVTLGLEPHEL